VAKQSNFDPVFRRHYLVQSHLYLFTLRMPRPLDG